MIVCQGICVRLSKGGQEIAQLVRKLLQTHKVGGSSLTIDRDSFWSGMGQKWRINLLTSRVFKCQLIAQGGSALAYNSCGWRFKSNHWYTFILKSNGPWKIHLPVEGTQEFSCGSAWKNSVSEDCRMVQFWWQTHLHLLNFKTPACLSQVLNQQPWDSKSFLVCRELSGCSEDLSFGTLALWKPWFQSDLALYHSVSC